MRLLVVLLRPTWQMPPGQYLKLRHNRFLPHPFQYIFQLAEIPGVARDSIRNEGTPEINYGVI
jgi:hypothetical protein